MTNSSNTDPPKDRDGLEDTVPDASGLPHSQGSQEEEEASGGSLPASDELEAIDWDDRMKPEVLAMRVDLYHAAKNWELMAGCEVH